MKSVSATHTLAKMEIIYNQFAKYTLFLYVTVMLSYGRFFAIKSIKIQSTPIYITEIVLVLLAPLIFFKRRELLRIPKGVGVLTLLFLIAGSIHMIVALSQGQVLALRDIVLCGYVLFFPIVFLVDIKRDDLPMFLIMLFLSSVINITLCRFLLFRPAVFELPGADQFYWYFINTTRGFNYGIYYGMSISLVFCCLDRIKNFWLKVLLAVICSLNLYMVFILSKRSLWFVVFSMFVFLAFVLKKDFLRKARALIPAFTIIFLLFFTGDFLISRFTYGNIFTQRTQSLFKLFQKGKDESVKKIGLALINKIDSHHGQIEVLREHHRCFEIQSKDFWAESKDLKIDNEEVLEKLKELQQRVLAFEYRINKVDRSLVISEEEKEAFDKDIMFLDEEYRHLKTNMISQRRGSDERYGPLKTAFNRYFTQYHRERRGQPGTYKSAIVDNFWWRIDVWVQAIDFGLESPLLGKGFGVLPLYHVWNYFPRDEKEFSHKVVLPDSELTPAHNHLVTIFYKMGFLGIFLFISLNVQVLISALRSLPRIKNKNIRHLLIGLVGAFIFWHLFALFFNVIDSPPTSIFLWILIGAIFSVIRMGDGLQKK